MVQTVWRHREGVSAAYFLGSRAAAHRYRAAPLLRKKNSAGTPPNPPAHGLRPRYPCLGFSQTRDFGDGWHMLHSHPRFLPQGEGVISPRRRRSSGEGVAWVTGRTVSSGSECELVSRRDVEVGKNLRGQLAEHGRGNDSPQRVVLRLVDLHEHDEGRGVGGREADE